METELPFNWDMILGRMASRILELLASETAKAREEGASGAPMGVSEWKELGKKFKYDKYFKIVWPSEV